VALVGNFPPTSRGSSKRLFVKYPFGCFMDFVKLGPTSRFFGEAELVKLRVFGYSFTKRSQIW
jgi:hypothetical protein